ncbi:hypothetical protein SAMN06265367_108179 [Algoriphagus winogradskyi]|uniref:Uncharacterized protein n=1 Tax=Algoriphagus winogradskyi TaxID=237017 RepID=A0ABY1PI87_9BACT|nr:hypothetical protein SAMN06265367_108179 [Algoriphagus winogradskyi]
MIVRLIYLLLFFLGENVSNLLGIELQNILYFFVVFGILAIVLNYSLFNLFINRKDEYYIILVIIVLFSFRFFSGILSDSVRSILVLFVTPILFLLVPQNIDGVKTYNFKKFLMSLLFWFFVIECAIAVFEFFIKDHVFLWVNTTFDQISNSDGAFRSNSIHGAPLTNALLVTIVNSFIVISNLKSKYKLFLWSLGFIAVLTFNARIAILLNSFILIFYFGRIFFSTKYSVNRKMIISIGVFIISLIFLYLISSTNIGSRLFDRELFDQSSGEQRLAIFDIFDYYSIYSFFYGISMMEFNYIKDSFGLLIIENFWINILVLFGLVFLISLIFFYTRLVRRYLIFYSFKDSLIIVSVFLIITSINNSLFTQFFPLLLYLVCLDLFRPIIFNRIVNKRWLS